MAIEKKDIADLLDQIDEVVAELISLMSTISEDEVNIIPYQDSWTAGQLFQHIIKSTAGLVKAMQINGDTADRDPGEHIDNLKKIFLDFSTKLKSPGFIVPGAGQYEKTEIIQKLGHAFQELRESAKDTDLTVVIKGTPLGDSTKWEILHFVLYHSQRHLNQLKKINEALRNKV